MFIINYIKQLCPAILAFILVLVFSLPFFIPGLQSSTPLINSMLVFYWTIYRPRSLPYWYVFTFGMIYDAIAGLPIGLHGLLNVLLRSIILRYRDKYIKEPFVSIWFHYMLLSVLVLILQWMMLAFVYEYLFGIQFAIIQWLLSLMLYPFFHRLFDYVQGWMPRR